MDYREEERAAFNVVGLAIDTSVQDVSNVATKLWMDFYNRRDELKHRVPGKDYGLSFTLSMEACTFQHIACVEVDSTEDVPEGMVLKEVPAAKYVVFQHKGPVMGIGKTYEAIYTSGMKETGKTQDEAFWLEMYEDGYDHLGADSVMEIWVPVK